MPRKPREEVADGIFHVYARGNDKRPIYHDDADRHIYLRLLAATVERCRWRLLAYCLMPNHVHHLIETPDPNLEWGRRRRGDGAAMRQSSGATVRGGWTWASYAAMFLETHEARPLAGPGFAGGNSSVGSPRG